MALKKLFNQARSFASTPEGRRLINQAGNALRQRGTRGQGTRRPSGANRVLGLAERFLGRGSGGRGTGRTSPWS